MEEISRGTGKYGGVRQALTKDLDDIKKALQKKKYNIIKLIKWCMCPYTVHSSNLAPE